MKNGIVEKFARNSTRNSNPHTLWFVSLINSLLVTSYSNLWLKCSPDNALHVQLVNFMTFEEIHKHREYYVEKHIKTCPVTDPGSRRTSIVYFANLHKKILKSLSS